MEKVGGVKPYNKFSRLLIEKTQSVTRTTFSYFNELTEGGNEERD